MDNSFIKFLLMDLNKVKALVFSQRMTSNEVKFTLFKEGEKPTKMKINKTTSMNYLSIYELLLPTPFEFGKQYAITFSNFNAQPIDVSNAPHFAEFDEMFNYDGDDLGAIYFKDYTLFNLWAPLASKVLLKIKKDNEEGYDIYPMLRTPHGVYRLKIEGDLLNKKYLYSVTNSGVTFDSIDPNGKGVDENSTHSGVVDIEYIKSLGKVKPATKIANYVDSFIYEVGIRDFTEQDKSTDIINKGKYLGFIEEGRKTKANHPAGLDYLINLGITHVQLNPVIDFGTVDDMNVSSKYNWGYDPISMFSLEGSYSLHPEIPMERLIEFKTLVNKLHEKDIRVILDVVYNHIYEHISSCYEMIVPNYYFRRKHDGGLAMASGCGDDVASEKYMVRKMIVDSMKYFVDVFDVDGYRFDLMGLLDIKTVKTGYEECQKLKDDIMMYGEGWNMGMELKYEEKACTDNAAKLPMFAFFNDTIRDIMKGPTFKDAITQKGYINGDTNYVFGFKHALYGSVLDINYNHRFDDANQSINYIECHDNNTLYDKLVFSNPDEDEVDLLKRIKLANTLLLSLFGVPFIHMGQEIGLSKKGNDNTYNTLRLNMMDWNLIDERYDMVQILKDMIEFRKYVPLYHLHTKKDLENALEYFDKDNLFVFYCKKPEYIGGYDQLVTMVNVTNKPINFEFDFDFRLIYSTNSGLNYKQELFVRNVTMPPMSVSIFLKGEVRE